LGLVSISERSLSVGSLVFVGPLTLFASFKFVVASLEFLIGSLAFAVSLALSLVAIISMLLPEVLLSDWSITRSKTKQKYG
jgi:hypothetical protein